MTRVVEPRTVAPAPVRPAQALLVLVGLSHLVVPVVMWAARSTLRDEIAAGHPSFAAAEIDKSAAAALLAATVFHGVLLVLCAVLVWLLASGRPWTRRLTTVSQLLSVGFGAVSWTSSPMFHAVVPVVAAVQLLVVALLWAPWSARVFFAKR
ncbi:hypothetical protein [Amycolatopsis sp. NPDC051903]|uniref:hypothetical protein n=1 Tax=Amycolatopsis sp. NPDC051903 TaxID=3363936 RepID=UPI00379DA68C